MRNLIRRLSSDFSFGPPATPEGLQRLDAIKGITLPDDYRAVIAESNGGEGFIGKQYLILWRAEELEQFNLEYEVGVYAPGFFLFGSNGGGEGFGFDTRGHPYEVVQVPFIGMDWKYADYIAGDFSSFLEKVSLSNG